MDQRAIAIKAADELFESLKAGRIPAIGLIQVRAYIRKLPDCPTNPHEFKNLVNFTIRKVVERATK